MKLCMLLVVCIPSVLVLGDRMYESMYDDGCALSFVVWCMYKPMYVVGCVMCMCGLVVYA